MEGLSDPVTVSSVSASQATCSLREMDRLPWKAVPDTVDSRKRKITVDQRERSVNTDLSCFLCWKISTAFLR